MFRLVAGTLFLISCSVMIVAQDRARISSPAAMKVEFEYKLLATKKTSTMQKEMMEAAEAGYQFVGFSTGPTLFGGSEVVTIMRRPR